jgi:putative ABC transport system substrate-binding protein
MNRVAALLSLLFCAASAHALEALPTGAMEDQPSFRIEVLQVTDIEPFQQSLDGFIKALQDNGIVAGKNLTVRRTKIDFDLEKGGFWDRVGVLLRIRGEALRIAREKPDLVLTIGTPATKYARGILDDAQVPVVFTAVANPLDAGCASLNDAGPGATGATLYTDMTQSLKVVKDIFPTVQKIGMVHSDDENGIAHVEATRATARELGIAVTSKLVSKNDNIVPSLKALFEQGTGTQLFAVPLDAYYGLRNYEPAKDLGDFGVEYQLPVVSFAMVRVPGALLYVGADFASVGGLSGLQAVKILKRHLRPDVLPILKQDRPTILVDPERVLALNVSLPSYALEHRSQARDGFWQISAER